MLDRFKSRSRCLERLDTGDYTTREYERWQREMPYIHGFFGEARALEHTLIAEVLGSDVERPSILDVGAGSGQLMRKVASLLGRRVHFIAGVELDATAARAIKKEAGPAVQSDALRMPFETAGFDYSYCTLFLHHLDDEPACRLLKEMARVTRRTFFVVDLNRSALAYYSFKIFGWPLLQRFTLEDGALSILRSRTEPELRELAQKAGLNNVNVRRSKLNRLILSASGQ